MPICDRNFGSGPVNISSLLVGVVLTAVFMLSFSASAASQSRYTTFDVPGAVGTYPASINQAGQITGQWWDSGTGHSFLRNTDGSIVTFDPPSGAYWSTATSINNLGQITGYFTDALGYHGYYRDTSGNITTFEASAGQNNLVSSAINDNGSIVGYYRTGALQHGFFRDPNGVVTTFDPPNAVNTYAQCINSAGYVSGAYSDSSSVMHGFILDPARNFTVVDVQGAGGPGTESGCLNDEKQMAGTYSDSMHVMHGYARSLKGMITTFSVPYVQNTNVATISPGGQIVGTASSLSVSVGFMRPVSRSSISVFKVPGADPGGIVAVSINASGIVPGFYFADNSGPRGFYARLN
jgi:hypothetical protein